MADKGLSGLVRATVSDVARLMKLEAALASQKLKGSAQAAGIGAAVAVGGLIFALFGLLLLLVAGAMGLALVLPLWAAFLVVGGGAVILAGVLVMVALGALRRASGRATGATDQLKEDLRWVRERSS
jgi:hypothetical protein